MPNDAPEGKFPDSSLPLGRVSRRRVLAAPAIGLGAAALDAVQRQAGATPVAGSRSRRGAHRQATPAPATPAAQPAVGG
ncbi:MAG: hypothetical protein KC442_17590, partial [Thermomicrobiales bacterium]|nr:hypothetical protein [Thermomicrobiales bacterium]